MLYLYNTFAVIFFSFKFIIYFSLLCSPPKSNDRFVKFQSSKTSRFRGRKVASLTVNFAAIFETKRSTKSTQLHAEARKYLHS